MVNTQPGGTTFNLRRDAPSQKMGFSGNVYFKGVLFSLIGQTPLAFIHIVAGPTGSILVEYNAGPMILNYPGFEYWRVTANTYGDVCID